jgi:hypothetical protein
MPDKKKVVVKVLKKSTPKMEEAVPKGMTKGGIDKINETTKFNAKSIATEARAKGDSISGANKAKILGKDIVDQKRAGNLSANATRVKEGNPQVMRGRTMTADSNYTDKYAPDGSKPSVDFYSRNKPLEKEMPRMGNKGITLTPVKKDSDKNKA